MKYKKPILIAEVGCNHKGDLNIAKKFIEVAKNFCGLKLKKFLFSQLLQHLFVYISTILIFVNVKLMNAVFQVIKVFEYNC